MNRERSPTETKERKEGETRDSSSGDGSLFRGGGGRGGGVFGGGDLEAVFGALDEVVEEVFCDARDVDDFGAVHFVEGEFGHFRQRFRELFEVLLQTFEEFPLLVGVGVQVVAEDVGRLERAPAVDDHFVGALEELNVDPRPVRRLLQLDHAFFRGGELLLREGLGLVVAVVALVEVEVPVELSFGSSGVGLLVAHLQRVVLVALVVAPRRGAVLRPVAHAHPAELVLALRAGHVVAALVLLDPRLTLGAPLRVRQNPVRRLALVLALLLPLPQ
mmetsp:Transcript_18663/g.57398  ORF Transcript_18663/g.57398 Transcript_18663/m.57398 type:complete len:274 (-) Transcript_18663:289-1110(-)